MGLLGSIGAILGSILLSVRFFSARISVGFATFPVNRARFAQFNLVLGLGLAVSKNQNEKFYAAR
jgi:hypothetical protein